MKTPAAPLKFDEIGAWSELKLEIVEKYGSAYTSAFSKKGSRLKKYYIDGFSGAGTHVAKRSQRQVEGSPARALKIVPPFDGFYFIDINPEKTRYLESLCEGRSNITIHTGDTNEYLVKQLFPTIKYENYNRALCLLDPYGLHLDWGVMLKAGQSRAVDLFLNFPVMDMNRNAIWRDPTKVPADGVQRMTRFWGDETWKSVVYAESPQQNLFSRPDLVKQANKTVVDAFRSRLRSMAGFAYVADPLPMRNQNNAIVYYLMFASPKPVAEKIVKDIFKKYI
ncbi:three-Cys-motif partner protein TcmP [Rhodoplanes azumiensis]|uniref:Three-Cys-motif partner protein TcmP n=1 Tax=Rhodoplanes azumiensis TaxID=1897628 RepID=A0ABW5AJ62_9BRAD